jgi:Zn ribbon nucleic-acid-binding protein
LGRLPKTRGWQGIIRAAMPTGDRLDALIGPLCPACQSPSTICIFERFGVRSYFCTLCDHTWQVPDDDGVEPPREAADNVW